MILRVGLGALPVVFKTDCAWLEGWGWDGGRAWRREGVDGTGSSRSRQTRPVLNLPARWEADMDRYNNLCYQVTDSGRAASGRRPDSCGPARLKTGLGWCDAIENGPYRFCCRYAPECSICDQNSQAQPVFKCCREAGKNGQIGR